jgi:hypothetical protein
VAGAAASATGVITGPQSVTNTVTASGGGGGSAGGPTGMGGAGGAASATATTTGVTISATATANGGAGGYAQGIGKVGGAGGAATLATATGKASGSGSTTVNATANGGGGGAGYAGADGGAGAASSLTNKVGGSTHLGNLYLTQTANGGGGGGSAGGTSGAGGAGASSLTYKDTATVKNALVYGSAVANGGSGGAGTSGSAGASGGAATASVNLTGSNAVTAYSTATGGSGGTGTTHGASGGATATTVATAQTAVQATATAQSGVGGTVTGPAIATVTGTGASGNFTATAGSSQVAGQLILSDSATTTGVVKGTASGQAKAAITGASNAFIKTGGVAFVTGAPNAASTTAVLSANSNISTAFGASPSFFAIGELGGWHSSLGNTAQVTTSTLYEAVDLTQLAVRGDLIVGLYNGAAVGSGVTSVTFDLYADGIDEIHQVFATAAQAVTYFSNHAFDLGSLATGQPLGANTLNLQATLSVTSTTAGGGFYGDLIIGDPPKANTHIMPLATTSMFAQAMAGLETNAGAGSGMGTHEAVMARPILALPSHYA